MDTAFVTAFEHVGYINAVAIAADGKYYVGGLFSSIDKLKRASFARFNSDATTVDTTFTLQGTGFNGQVRAIAVQTDGNVQHILVGGDFTTYNGTPCGRIVRLNTDGTLDTTFNSSTGFNGIVRSVVIQPTDKRILVGGSFTAYNGTTENYIARLNTDGTLDTTFAPGGVGFNNIVYSLAVQADGHIVVGGSFTVFNTTTQNYIARLNANGTLDTTFAPGTALNNNVFAVAVQADGNILAGGLFTAYGSTAANYLARLTTAGALDTTFATTIGAGANGPIYSLALQSLQSVQHILVGGSFSSFNSAACNNIARLNSDGSLDAEIITTTDARFDGRNDDDNAAAADAGDMERS
jgi:uncharacterized delta-60 repeat protein